MDIKYINPFISGFLNVCSLLGMKTWQRSSLDRQDTLRIEQEVNIIIGLTGETRGNVVLSMSELTARSIASTMMGGLPVEQFDMMARSALCELTNMVAGNSATNLAEHGTQINITPPTLISGKNLLALVSQIETLVIEFTGQEGKLVINIALES
ncbi:MAG: chemotaxis protein CheX [Syntrophomonadaceae bacterium]|jgi:chemotaxis protein CheX|nr:chemotaxis protein CheX [Syntrophomonadaceae bacterium]